MKKIVYLFSLLPFLNSCRFTTGSGNIISETRQTGNFEGISVGGSFDVEVKTGTETSVVVEADDNIMKYIETTVSGGVLRIRTEGMNNYSNVHMKVLITVPGLNSIKASASAEVEVEGILANQGRLIFKASSSASIRAEVNAPEVETEASSSGTVTLSGKTKTHKAGASSSGDIKCFDLLSENVIAGASSSGNIEVHASVSLNAQASSSGSVDYRGAATVTKSESSSGSVEKKD
ncbi:MAG: DUF2807 domain-containing protein [Ferruginibacter sp.]|nr:DUF2807 domain-containing protein [Ferruginibacter sp.]